MTKKVCLQLTLIYKITNDLSRINVRKRTKGNQELTIKRHMPQ